MNELEVMLPQTVAELDVFVATIATEFSLPNTDDTYEAIATLIMHMPPSVCTAPKSYFANSVRKSIANLAAYTKLREFSDKRKQAESVQAEQSQREPFIVQD